MKLNYEIDWLKMNFKNYHQIFFNRKKKIYIYIYKI